jgi:predicted RNA-binding Zn-ribbon protein involved in translation (DUF1610 family)
MNDGARTFIIPKKDASMMTCPNCGGAMSRPARAGYTQCAECAYVPAHGAD